MKKLFLIVLFLSTCIIASGQEKAIELDYFVDYVVHNGAKNTKDTITIGFNKDGKYLWSDFDGLASDFSQNIFKNSKSNNKFDSNIIYESEGGLIYFSFDNGNNLMFLKVSLSEFMPPRSEEIGFNMVNLISEKTGNKVSVLDKKHEEYKIYTSDDKEGGLYAVLDESINLDNNRLLIGILSLLMDSSMGMTLMEINIPNGLILQVSEGVNPMIEAINVSNKKKTITLNFSISTKE